MKKKIKKVAKMFLTQNQIHRTKMFIMRILAFKRSICTNHKLEIFEIKQGDVFFGYYDITPFNDSTNNLVYLTKKINSNIVEITFNDVKNNMTRTLGTTQAWNWQQGARLRWFPKSEEKIMFNDCIDDKFVTKILDINTNVQKIINWPIYDVDKDGKHGITLDFNRLSVLRPGYGYTNKFYVAPKTFDNEGVSLIDMDQNTCRKIINYPMINKVLGGPLSDFSHSYINHLSFSPSGDKFLFFWLNIKDNGAYKASLLVYDIRCENLIGLENELSVSHYDWIDDEKIIVTAYNDSRKCNYYIYNINGTKEVLLPDLLTRDGHPTWLGDGKMITDTYLDKYGYQKILHVDIEEGRVNKLIDIYSTYKCFGERRCDLHPRVNKRNLDICFDANVKGNRKLYILKGWN